MTQQDFRQLLTSLQREFTLNASIQLGILSIDREIIIDLFYSCNGNFFIELYTTRERNVALDINSFNFNNHLLKKYLPNIGISSVYDKLNDID